MGAVSSYDPNHRGVAAIITDGTAYVLQQKDAGYTDHPHGYSWFSGAMEPDETPDQAIRRELREELPSAAETLINSIRRPHKVQTIIADYKGERHLYPLHVFFCDVSTDFLGSYRTWEVTEGARALVALRPDLDKLDWVWGLEPTLALIPMGMPR